MRVCCATVMGALFLVMTTLTSFAAYMEPIDRFKDAEPPEASAVVRVNLTFEPPGEQQSEATPPDITVLLCKTAVKKQIAAVRKTGNILAGRTGHYRALFSDIDFMSGRAQEQRVARTITDNATYVIKNVSPGESYLLYGSYRDGNTAAYWLVPVTVNEVKKYDITLSEKNIQEVYHKKGKAHKK